MKISQSKILINTNFKSVNNSKENIHHNTEPIFTAYDDISSVDKFYKSYFEANQNINNSSMNTIVINSTTPIKRPDDLSDTKEFAKYLEYKIAKNLNVISEEEVKILVEKIANEMKVDEQLVIDVMAKLTQFSSYSQLDDLSTELRKESIGYPKIFSKLSINNLLEYVGEKKNQIKFYRGYKSSIFVDEQILSYFEEMKEKIYPIGLEDYKKMICFGNMNLVLIDGWNIYNNGKTHNYSMFGQNTSLEDLTKVVINKIKNENISIDEAINGECIKRIKNIFGEGIKITKISNPKIQNATTKTITDFINPNMPNRAEIYSIIDRIVRTKITSKFNDVNNPTKEEDELEKNAREEIATYLEKELVCFSSSSLNKILKEKYNNLSKKLEEIGKNIDDCIYYIPETRKSYDLITYQYLNANNLPFDKVISGTEIYEREKVKDKTIIILDDVAGTGQSMVSSGFNYSDYLKDCKTPPQNIIFSPIITLEQGKNLIEQKIKENGRIEQDFLFTNITLPQSRIKNSKLNNKKILENALLFDGFGYFNNASCIALPYSFPDNNSGLGSLFSRYFLSNKLSNGKQSDDLYFSNQNLTYGTRNESFLNMIDIGVKRYKD